MSPSGHANKPQGVTTLSRRAVLELVAHEAAVLEAYKDSKGIWTWGVGVTSASGHDVMRYKDNPQPLARVIEVFEWLLKTKYLPDVLKAFEGFPLTEAQLAAAVSFHYNTGAIKRASWVKSVKAGDLKKAKEEFLRWNKPPEIFGRRKKEAELFFEGKWNVTANSKVLVYTAVKKPSYLPDRRSAKLMDF